MSTINVTSATAQGVLDIISNSKSTVKLNRQEFAVPEPHGLIWVKKFQPPGFIIFTQTVHGVCSPESIAGPMYNLRTFG
jgi:hypothetical protein